jgi:hypothetical protein
MKYPMTDIGVLTGKGHTEHEYSERLTYNGLGGPAPKQSGDGMHEKVIRVPYNQGVGETLHANPNRLNQSIRHRQFPRCSKVAKGKFT